MTEIRYCANCGNPIRKEPKMGPKGYAARRFCSRTCNSKVLTGPTKRNAASSANEWQKRSRDMWRMAMSKRRQEAPEGTYFETVEEYLSRGGKITQCEPGGAEGALYLSRSHVGGMNGKRA